MELHKEVLILENTLETARRRKMYFCRNLFKTKMIFMIAFFRNKLNQKNFEILFSKELKLIWNKVWGYKVTVYDCTALYVILDNNIILIYTILTKWPQYWSGDNMHTLLQPIAQKQQSFIKDTTDFISFIEKTKIGKDTILVSMDVSSLYTN